MHDTTTAAAITASATAQSRPPRSRRLLAVLAGAAVVGAVLSLVLGPHTSRLG